MKPQTIDNSRIHVYALKRTKRFHSMHILYFLGLIKCFWKFIQKESCSAIIVWKIQIGFNNTGIVYVNIFINSKNNSISFVQQDFFHSNTSPCRDKSRQFKVKMIARGSLAMEKSQSTTLDPKHYIYDCYKHTHSDN